MGPYERRSGAMSVERRDPAVFPKRKVNAVATRLLPNPVAAHVTGRDVMDGRAKIIQGKQYRAGQAVTRWNGRKRITNAVL
jgi:hypothetical protein